MKQCSDRFLLKEISFFQDQWDKTCICICCINFRGLTVLKTSVVLCFLVSYFVCVWSFGEVSLMSGCLFLSVFPKGRVRFFWTDLWSEVLYIFSKRK